MVHSFLLFPLCHHPIGATELPVVTTRRPCSSTEFMCEDNHRCKPNRYRCNGYLDCSDGSDEKGCGKIRYEHLTPSQSHPHFMPPTPTYPPLKFAMLWCFDFPWSSPQTPHNGSLQCQWYRVAYVAWRHNKCNHEIVVNRAKVSSLPQH